MTQSDSLTAAAVRTGTPLRINDREVTIRDGTVQVSLHGKPCLTLDNPSRTIEIDGDTLPTRKSCRVVNAILGTLSPCRVLTRNKKWYLETEEGKRLPFTNRLVTVPVNIA
jgi:hypothetical protein